jgi:hypothetical protein
MLGHDPVEHRLRVLEEGAGAFAHHLVLQDSRVIARKLPGAEERGPVDRLPQVAQRPLAELVEAGTQRRRRLAAGIEGQRVGARFAIGESSFCPLPARASRTCA